METTFHPKQFYRLPWTLNDNILGWLEPTKRCNLYCEGCYSRNDVNSDKTLEEVRADLVAFTAQRKMDSISIAGGDPLLHPQIPEIVRMIREEFGMKPILNTNALALTPELLEKLVDAGLEGFTFHIDSSQGRPHHKGKTEVELNALRLHYAEMVAAAGDLSVNFNCTIFPHTLKDVPMLMEWAAEHIDIVHGMVFILFRTMRTKEFTYFRDGEAVDPESLVYYDMDQNPEPLTADDVIREIHKVDPDYHPAAYLGGTHDPNAFKWLLGGRVGSRGSIHGYVGPKYMEMVQSAHHAVTGRWLGYVKPSMLSHGRTMLAGFSPFDSDIRGVLKGVLKKPWKLAKRMYFQSILIIQPIDMMEDGRMSMCDGCPDMTIHDGQLVWSCRLDERHAHGCFLTAAPMRPAADEAPAN
jgi:pyruvate-formate lyase-activating enzyme